MKTNIGYIKDPVFLIVTRLTLLIWVIFAAAYAGLYTMLPRIVSVDQVYDLSQQFMVLFGLVYGILLLSLVVLSAIGFLVAPWARIWKTITAAFLLSTWFMFAIAMLRFVAGGFSYPILLALLIVLIHQPRRYVLLKTRVQNRLTQLYRRVIPAPTPEDYLKPMKPMTWRRFVRLSLIGHGIYSAFYVLALWAIFYRDATWLLLPFVAWFPTAQMIDALKDRLTRIKTRELLARGASA